MKRAFLLTMTSASTVLIVPFAAWSLAGSVETKRVSVSSAGAQGNEDSVSGSISAGGRFVAFDSASKLVSGDTNSYTDVFVRGPLP
jgi:hypothetical protein